MTMSKTRESNCGCSRGSACGCGGVAALCNTEGTGAPETYVRPNFFAGQLLTEDDLDRLVEYTTAKLRLRNRNLFGSGVVCGLEVGCQPCGNGRVVVNPGHALDCCGNDIVVPCAEQLDVNAMLHELRTKLRGGWDCGDPCAREQPSPKPKPKPAELDNLAYANNKAKAEAEVEQPPAPSERGRCYALWIIYDEQRFDLQTPYETDDPCSSRACEPTRIRESYRFELRCPEPEAAPVDLFSRALGCLTEFVGSTNDVTVARALQVGAVHAQQAQAKIAAEPDQHWRIHSAHSYSSELESASSRVAEHIEAGTNIDPRAAMRELASLAGLRLRFQFHTPVEREQLIEMYPPLSSVLHGAVEQVLKAANDFGPSWQQQHFAVELERHQARAVTDVIGKWYPKAGPNEVVFAEHDAVRNSYEARLLSERLAYTATLHGRHAQALAELRDALRRVLDRRRVITDCALAGDLDGLRLPTATAGAEVSDAELASFVVAALTLGELLLRWLRECICGALQPVCPSCDDDGVLLACLRVDNCEVLEICNLERRWVLTSVNVRYWLPPLRLLGDLLEKACCELPMKLDFLGGDRRDAIKEGKQRAAGNAFKYVKVPEFKAKEWIVPLVEGPFIDSPVPSALLGTIGETWIGQPIKWDDFRTLASEVGNIIVSRTGKLELDFGRRRVDKQVIDVAEALSSGPAKHELGLAVDRAVNEAVEAGRINLGDSLRRSSEATLELIRQERDAEVARQLDKFVSTEDGGLRAALAPLLDERVELATGDLRKRIEAEVSRRIRDSGLDTRGRELWLNAALDARLAELNLQPEAIRNRTERLTEKILADHNLIGELLDRRLREEVDARITSLGLDPEGLDHKLDAKLRSQLAETGLDEVDTRVETNVRRVLAAEALLGEGLEERLAGALERRLIERPATDGGSADTTELRAELDRANTSIRSLRSQLSTLKKKVEELSGNG